MSGPAILTSAGDRSARARKAGSSRSADVSWWRPRHTSSSHFRCWGDLPEPDDFFLFPEKRTGERKLLAVYPKRAPTDRRWWYRHAAAAGRVGKGTTSGMNMHRARHTFATDLRRVADLGAASQALGHSDLSTTAAIYGH